MNLKTGRGSEDKGGRHGEKGSTGRTSCRTCSLREETGRASLVIRE